MCNPFCFKVILELRVWNRIPAELNENYTNPLSNTHHGCKSKNLKVNLLNCLLHANALSQRWQPEVCINQGLEKLLRYICLIFFL